MDERITKFFSGELNANERVELLRERERNEQLKQDFSSFQNMLATLSFAPEAIDRNTGEYEYKELTRYKQKKNRILYMKKALGYAAAIAIAIAVVATWTITTTNEFPAEPQSVQQELFVPAGQRARITLPDGTVAWVNAGSTLLYPSSFVRERNVVLSGEAFFDVAQDKKKPFIVSTDQMNIEALGTQFNVYGYPDNHASTILVEGAIKVYPSQKGESIVLSPGQQLFCEDGQFRLEDTVDTDDLLWREGLYNFKKQRLENIIKKLELYYDVDIIVEDPSILDFEYTGKFRQRDGVLEILRIIRKIHGFTIEQDKELNQITLSR